ncbi:hypothetical protein ACFU99_05880 [Streptomyces sp. NPDC057654]|uniref:hypothetical protein n=1 Tax=Streptomyces sp. NPDC057654 TaxID=3346196 RepID=UPI00368B8A1B
MAIVVEGFLRCPGCREYVIGADEEQFPDGVDYETPGADQATVECLSCRGHPEEDELGRAT